jgi:EAL domain-containing protein (putative c-di-GMP-specific phosphodiesterase class I)
LGRENHTLSDKLLEPSRLKLEITESAILEHKKETIANIERLNALGVQLQLDDFGTGQSSIGYLHQFFISTLKIDRSFVNKMGNEHNINLVRGIINMAHALKLNVIAEGIETQEQEKLLMEMKCPYGQGYKISQPLLDSEIKQFIIQEASRVKQKNA